MAPLAVCRERPAEPDPLRPLELARREWRLPRSSGHSCTRAARQVIRHCSHPRRIAYYASTFDE